MTDTSLAGKNNDIVRNIQRETDAKGEVEKFILRMIDLEIIIDSKANEIWYHDNASARTNLSNYLAGLIDSKIHEKYSMGWSIC
jgi:hypothetical protein